MAALSAGTNGGRTISAGGRVTDVTTAPDADDAAGGDITHASNGIDSMAVGADAFADGARSQAGGVQSAAEGDNSTAFGFRAEADGAFSTAVGCSARAIGEESIALGDGAEADGFGATAVGGDNGGGGAYAIGDRSTVIGSSARAEGVRSVAIGASAVAADDHMGKIKVDGFEVESSSASGAQTFMILTDSAGARWKIGVDTSGNPIGLGAA